MAKKGATKARRRGFELQSSELWGSKNDLSAHLQFQLNGLKPNLSQFSSLNILQIFFSNFLGFNWRETQ